MHITQKIFGYTKCNEPVSLYCLKNSSGSYVEVLDYGCRIRSICVPDKTGALQDVCLGYQSFAEYENDEAYFGVAVGRCAIQTIFVLFRFENKIKLVNFRTHIKILLLFLLLFVASSLSLYSCILKPFFSLQEESF